MRTVTVSQPLSQPSHVRRTLTLAAAENALPMRKSALGDGFLVARINAATVLDVVSGGCRALDNLAQVKDGEAQDAYQALPFWQRLFTEQPAPSGPANATVTDVLNILHDPSTPYWPQERAVRTALDALVAQGRLTVTVAPVYGLERDRGMVIHEFERRYTPVTNSPC